MAKKRNPLKPTLILASASPRRRLLMRQGGYRFRIVPSDAKETFSKSLRPGQIVARLALKKALAVARRFPESVVLGADTLVFLKGKVIGKPRDQKDAVRILKTLSGAWQQVYTGVAVVRAGGTRRTTGVAISRVKIKPLSEREINSASAKHLDKAGAYSIQHKNDKFVERLVGDYDNVVGLPMRLVKRLLGSRRLFD